MYKSLNSVGEKMAKKIELQKDDKIVLSTYIKLVRAGESVSARAHKHLTKVKMSFGQFAIIEAIYHLGSMCQKDLANKILKSPRNITMIVDNLEKRNLVERKRNKSDRRFWDIHLTQKGEQLFEEIFPRHIRSIQKEMSILDDTELKIFGDLCRIIGTQKR